VDREARRVRSAEGTLPARLAFLSVAVWWFAFSIPLFRRVTDPPPRGAPPGPRRSTFAAAFSQIAATYRELRRYPQAFLMLVAFLLFNDGIGTVSASARSTRTR